MLHIFDECANERYERTTVSVDENHENDHASIVSKRRINLNECGG